MRNGPRRAFARSRLPLAAALVLATLSAGIAQTPPLEELISAVVRIKTFINPDGRTLQNLGREREGSGHRHRRQRPGADHRLPDGRGARRARSPPTTAARCRRTWSATTTRPVSDCCRRSRRSRSSRSPFGKSADVKERDAVVVASFGGPDRAGACSRCRQARIRRQLGIHARRGDLHLAAASAMERRGADQPRGQAGRRRLAHRRRCHRPAATTSPATCSCRSTGCRRSSAT